ncbi:hypothetical protein HDU84_008599 [Entophlyctis sp. JEL0112]|nr:hypothetical protein HDU84_008599 [Entophlyctis sp. JEL0112]
MNAPVAELDKNVMMPVNATTTINAQDAFPLMQAWKFKEEVLPQWISLKNRRHFEPGTIMEFVVTHIAPVLCALSFMAGACVPAPHGKYIGCGVLALVAAGITYQALRPHHPRAAVTMGRRTAKIEGDFVVFLIGSRYNSSSPLSANYVNIAGAFTRMIEELRTSDPLVSGFLGSDEYSGLGSPSTTLSVQYWRSKEHLHDWAVSRMSALLALERNHEGNTSLLKAHFTNHHSEQLLRSNPKYGIWHETFLVRDGEYETMYVHMPNFGLAGASENVAISGETQSMYQRLGKRDSPDNDVPSDWRDEAAQY